MDEEEFIRANKERAAKFSEGSKYPYSYPRRWPHEVLADDVPWWKSSMPKNTDSEETVQATFDTLTEFMRQGWVIRR